MMNPPSKMWEALFSAFFTLGLSEINRGIMVFSALKENVKRIIGSVRRIKNWKSNH